MAKLKCTCGNIIKDSSENKSLIISEATLSGILAGMIDDVEGLINALKSNERDSWIKAKFQVPPYPLDLNESSMLSDLWSGNFGVAFSEVYKCQVCGRIWIQNLDSEEFRGYSPQI